MSRGEAIGGLLWSVPGTLLAATGYATVWFVVAICLALASAQFFAYALYPTA